MDLCKENTPFIFFTRADTSLICFNSVFFSLLWDWGLGPFQLGKIATKQEIWEISFYIIYSGSNQIKAQCFFSWRY
jgi:hypothetical protein